MATAGLQELSERKVKLMLFCRKFFIRLSADGKKQNLYSEIVFMPL
jgi:hypothetical protein